MLRFQICDGEKERQAEMFSRSCNVLFSSPLLENSSRSSFFCVWENAKQSTHDFCAVFFHPPEDVGATQRGMWL